MESVLIQFILFIFFTNSVLIHGKNWPAWLDVASTIESLGSICESDNDIIGRKLGCDCTFPVSTPGTNLVADCSAQSLGTPNSLLPQYINVSIHVRNLIFNDNYIEELNERTFGSVDGVLEASFKRNRIHFVTGIQFPRVATLDLSYNRIRNLTSISFSNLPKLENLDLNFNGLFDIAEDTFSKLEYLRTLNLGSNLIGVAETTYDDFTFTLSGLNHLENIDLRNNTLLDFPKRLLENIPNLKHLNLRDNRIFSIPSGTFDGLVSLESLDLSGNIFTLLHQKSFHGLIHLKKLIIDENYDLILIENHAFEGLISLHELSCQRNHLLEHIEHLAFKGEEGVENSSNPVVVSLGDNALSSLDEDLLDWKKMEYLELRRNPWLCDCNLQWVPKLKDEAPSEAAILLDQDFQCSSPSHLKGIPVAEINISKGNCSSHTASSVIGIVAVVLTAILVLGINIVFVLNRHGMLPQKLRFRSTKSFPYVKVQHKSIETINTDNTVELEWDNAGDIGR